MHRIFMIHHSLWNLFILGYCQYGNGLQHTQFTRQLKPKIDSASDISSKPKPFQSKNSLDGEYVEPVIEAADVAVILDGDYGPRLVFRDNMCIGIITSLGTIGAVLDVH